MPPQSTAIAILGVFLAMVLAAPGQSVAQVSAPRTPTPAPATPEQTQAIATFRPHAEQVCRALYVRPDAAATCVQRILDAAVPLALDSAELQAPGAIPSAVTGRTTVAPDGRE